jgi:hypothetical protein
MVLIDIVNGLCIIAVFKLLAGTLKYMFCADYVYYVFIIRIFELQFEL